MSHDLPSGWQYISTPNGHRLGAMNSKWAVMRDSTGDYSLHPIGEGGVVRSKAQAGPFKTLDAAVVAAEMMEA